MSTKAFVLAFLVGLYLKRKDYRRMTVSPSYLKTVSLQSLRSQANLKHDHARGCQKAGCQVCLANRAWFDSLPAGVLADVLADCPVKKG